MCCSSTAVERDFMNNLDAHEKKKKKKKKPLQFLHLFPGSPAAPTKIHDEDEAVSAGKYPLTIFYKGSVTVYDNVSMDQARAIMLLARENPVSAPLVKNMVVLGAASNIGQTSNPSSSAYKIHANLPIATKRSLKLFFDKRRDRIMKSSPYVRPKEEESST